MLSGSLVAFAGCDKDNGKDDKPKDTSASTGENGEDLRFEGVDYDGREFRIYTSIHKTGAGLENSNTLIEGTGKTNGALVNDAVFERNENVERLLDVKLTYEHADFDYLGVPEAINKLVLSNTDEMTLSSMTSSPSPTSPSRAVSATPWTRMPCLISSVVTGTRTT